MSEFTGLPWPTNAQRLGLGEIEIDLRYRNVVRDGVVHELNPRCFDLLLLFLREPGVLHTREAIFRKVWPGVVVEDTNLTTSIWMLRRAFGGVAKQWIRTVSKQGYVFDPPASVCLAVRAPDAPQMIAVDDVAAVHAGAAARSRRLSIALTLAAVLAALAVGSAILHVGTAVPPTLRVALVIASDGTSTDESRWSSTLLHEWLDWQLRSLARIDVANPADTCSGCNELAVLLGVDPPEHRDGEWQVSARFRGAAPHADIVHRCSGERLIATIDQVSREVLATLVPAIDASGYPPLQLDAAAAVQLVEASAAERQHRWSDAVGAYRRVVDAAPGFGYAQVRLARGLAELGQQGPAQAELARAEAWIALLPESLRQPIEAEASLIRQDHAAAAAAYTAMLQAAGRDITTYRLAEAASLRRAGRSRDAAERLAGQLPSTPSHALRWLIERTEAEIANRDLARASSSAAEALALAGKLERPHDRARAALLFADAQLGSGQVVDDALFERAAHDFERSGDALGALRARVQLELARAQGGATSAHLAELLSAARTAGNAGVEIDALRRAGWSRYRAGDAREAHERFMQAAALAESGGNLHERHLVNLDLLREDTLKLDFAALDHRLALLQPESLQGGMAFAAGLNAARLQYLRGNFDAALATLTQTEDALRETDTSNLPQIASTIGCMRIALHMVMGQSATARDDIRDCRASGLPVNAHFADIADAELAIHTGDLIQARRLLTPMRSMLANQAVQPDRWNLAAEIAPLLARVGELDGARQMLDDVLPAITHSGYRLIEANARITRAEIALAQGRPDEAEREVSLGEAMVPADDWYERRRLRTVHALIAQARGQHELATHMLEALHADTRAHDDVLGELLVHSLMGANPSVAGCSDQRRVKLLAQSGMRGASDIWMNPDVHGARTSLAATQH
jgi:DNA-binding winged helix-turn-helix (wHTH) protein